MGKTVSFLDMESAQVTVSSADRKLTKAPLSTAST